MATSTYLSNPVCEINSVDVTDQVSASTFTRVIEALESTSFGKTARVYTAGLENSTMTLTMYNSFAATETYATLAALVGTSTTVTIKPTSAATSATNPKSTLTGCYLETLPIVNAALGALDTIDIVFTGGVYSVAVA
jgi:poly(3-hydroxybutyrate) depolymerase